MKTDFKEAAEAYVINECSIPLKGPQKAWAVKDFIAGSEHGYSEAMNKMIEAIDNQFEHDERFDQYHWKVVKELIDKLK